jgi:hypothetical protein
MKKNYLFIVFTILFMGLSFSACNNDDDDNPNDGKIDPGTIATANLVAYFPFDENGVEKISNISPDKQKGVTYVEGRRGKAYQGADNAYLTYVLPASNKLKTLTSFAMAFWLKSPLVTGDPEPLIFQIGKEGELFWGNLSFALNRLNAAADSLQLKTFFLKDTGIPWANQHISYSNPVFTVNKWMYLVIQYDETTSKYAIYKDGVKINLPDNVANRKDNENGNPLGAMVFTRADKIIIGGWRTKIDGNATDDWMGWFKGNLDELRIYNKALSDIEVKALYDAEITQVNP